jgi:osmotically-inducible protein OsmY
MKSDTQLNIDVRAELDWEPRVRGSEIGLAVKDGVVTLTGTVDSYAKKSAAEQAVARVGGVHVVADELTVRLTAPSERTDTEIGHQVKNALAWHIEIPQDRITARVENGWVWLVGDVDWQYQRLAATGAVRFLTGVKGVTNAIRIKEHVSADDVSLRIEAALSRSADAVERKIEVQAKDGCVTLTGTVRTAGEREEAEYAAWSARGVTSVDDRIVVSD